MNGKAEGLSSGGHVMGPEEVTNFGLESVQLVHHRTPAVTGHPQPGEVAFMVKTYAGNYFMFVVEPLSGGLKVVGTVVARL